MNGKAITIESPKASAAEAYRILRTNILFLDNDIKSIVVTSAGRMEGKTTVAVNLAVTMCQIGKRVLLIDGNLRNPDCHQYFSLNNGIGLADILVDDLNCIEVGSPTGINNLDIITSGAIPPNPSELLSSDKMKALLKKFKTDYDLVILDTPPVGLVTDAAILSTIADGTILICAVGRTIKDELKNAKTILNKVNAKIMGVVMNRV